MKLATKIHRDGLAGVETQQSPDQRRKPELRAAQPDQPAGGSHERTDPPKESPGRRGRVMNSPALPRQSPHPAGRWRRS